MVVFLSIFSGPAGCEPDIAQNEITPGARALFDSASGQIPLPTDVLRDPTTGRLQVPVDDKSDSLVTKEIKASLNRLDGWPAASTITLPVDDALDLTSLNSDSVFLFDVTAGTVRIEPSSYVVLYNHGPAPRNLPPYLVTIKNKPSKAFSLPPDFLQAHRYLAVLTDKVKDKGGRALIGTAALELLKSPTSLVDKSGHSTTILDDASANLLEYPRKNYYAPSFDALALSKSLDRESAKAFTVFTIQGSARPAYNPTSIQTKMPSPYDKLVGEQLVPIQAPLDSKISVQFDLQPSADTVKGAIRLFRMSSTEKTAKGFSTQVAGAADASGLWNVEIIPDAALEANAVYMVAVTNAVKGMTGLAAQASTYSSLLAGQNELLDNSTSPPSLSSPYLDSSTDVLLLLGKDPQVASQADWSTANTMLIGTLKQLEVLRKIYSPHYEYLASIGDSRDQIVALWTFTTAGQ